MQIYQPGKLRVNPSPEDGCPAAAATSATGVKKRVSRYSEKRRAKETSSGGPTPSSKEEQETPADNL